MSSALSAVAAKLVRMTCRPSSAASAAIASVLRWKPSLVRFLSYRFPGKLGGGCDARYRPSVADDLSDLFSARQSGALVVSIDGLAKLFELTPSEQAVARSLVNGADPREIAEERHNSIETVRSHLKSIFSKTGARSQLALMRLAVKANPPVDAA